MLGCIYIYHEFGQNMIEYLECLCMSLFRYFHDYRPGPKTWVVRQSKFVRVNRVGKPNVLVAPYNIITRVLDIHMYTTIAASGFQIGIQNEHSVVNQIPRFVDALVRLNQNRMLFGLEVQLSLVGELNSPKTFGSKTVSVCF